ncbi:Isochorismatase hydrolase [Bibersteinia trehalosi USDA-ARS-USMARC-189]|uniref:Isochorismatase hydrolase n=2 Tax=Bibersteinia trehalosi TaxID=47735 RepID=A0ABM5PHB1_BIBTR|nr:Isochorismatase hydrolase [Bibersteinia trehalosi USDA-ARS-USMARC-192]AHG85160.1 Isochorismatase hydrolase [Bibersteinia trehalosi USDA-ARS-USMARC-189]
MYQPFNAQNSILLLIDHQVGTMSWVGSISFEEMKQNALMLAKSAAALGMPAVLTSSMEEYAQGPLLSELKDILPSEFENRVLRAGIVNAMTDENFANAVKNALGERKRLIVAGVTNDVCTVYPVLTLLEQGYEVQVVADAGGSPTKMADDIAIRRMENAGAVITSTNQLLAELAQDWSGEDGQKILPIIVEALQK